MNHIRDNKKFISPDLPQSLEALANHIDNRDFMESAELEKKILDAINDLPEACKRIFLMSRFEDKKYKDIAEELDISIKTVETQMTKALRIMREKLSDYIKIMVIIITLIIRWFF